MKSRGKTLAFAVFLGSALLATQSSAADVQWMTLKVEGMTCGSCEFHVKRALKKVPGVNEAMVSAEEGYARVSYDAGKAKPEDLVEAINKTGYQASLPDSATGGE